MSDTRITRLASETAEKWTNDHAEALARLIEAALTDLARQIREDDAPYMQHRPDCGNGKPRMVVYFNGVSQDGWRDDCTCGLTALRARD